jgi:hypothetical protein
MIAAQLWHWVQSFAWTWKDSKELVEHSISFSPDSLHVLTGVVILLGTARILRRSIGAWAPWLVVLFLACVIEVIDIAIDQWPQRGMQYGESVRDIVLTMFLPTLLLFAARAMPQLFRFDGESKA